MNAGELKDILEGLDNNMDQVDKFDAEQIQWRYLKMECL